MCAPREIKENLATTGVSRLKGSMLSGTPDNQARGGRPIRNSNMASHNVNLRRLIAAGNAAMNSGADA